MPKFAKNMSRPPNAGRKKGTPNRKTQALEDIARKLGADPFEVMCRFIANDWKGLGYDSELKIVAYSKDGEPIYNERISAELRLHAAKEASKYLYPQRKAVEISGEIKNPYLEKPLKELEALVKEKLKAK